MQLLHSSSFTKPHMREFTCILIKSHCSFSSSIAFTPLIVAYTVEILPYSIRAKGFVVFNFAISLSLIFNQYVNPVAMKEISWKYYVSCCSSLTIDPSNVLLDRVLCLACIRDCLLLLLHRGDQRTHSGRDCCLVRRRGSCCSNPRCSCSRYARR